MKNLPPYSSDHPRRRNGRAVRRQPQPPVPAWKKPRVWFRIVLLAFSVNLIIAIVTIERHISFSTLTSSSNTLEMDRPKANTKMSPMSSRWRQEQPRAQFVTESRIWHRMLLQHQEPEKEGTKHHHHFFCNTTNGGTQTIASLSSGANRQGLVDDSDGGKRLSPFGFPETVRAYVQEHECNNETKDEPLSRGLSTSSSSMYCLAPPSEPSCQSFQYTVVIYSSGGNNNNNRNDVGEVVVRKNSTAFDYPRPNHNADSYWRNIVVGAMKFLAYPSVQRVNLVLRDEIITTAHNNTSIEVGASTDSGSAKVGTRRRASLEVSAKRNKYAKRVLNWSRKGVVNVVSTSSLWDAIQRLEVPSESMLWIDGDYRFDFQNNNSNNNIIAANGTALKHQFRTWREVPNALVIPRENRIVPVSPSKTNGHNDDKTNDCGTSVVCTVPLLHEMMMHRNYLCYLNHPVVGSELRNYTDSALRRRVIVKDDNASAWDATTMAIGMLLFSIGDGYVLENAADHFSAATYKQPLLPFYSAADGDNGTLIVATDYAKEIANYFGCPCSMAIPRLSPSNIKQCTSGKAAPQ